MYSKKVHIHFVGIGGIGMSGIATILRYQGYSISGCDLDLDQISIKNLKNLGCHIFAGNNTPDCHKNVDILVYSSAIKNDNAEIRAAQQKGIPTIPRALMLAELMRTKYSVAIAGSHGKTTTTSLISHILIEAGMDPTVIIGGHLTNLSNNARYGQGDFLVAEADESDRSLLHLKATLALVTNIDLEHLETYRDLDDIKNTFHRFLSDLPFYGKAFLCADDPNIDSLLPITHVKTVTYGYERPADVRATDIKLLAESSTFTVHHQTNELGSIYLTMPGRHNVLNSLGAIALCYDLGISFPTIAQALATFKGVERRFSFRGIFNDAEIFDDYGHHPREIAETIVVARRRSKNRLTVIFQPHRYSRTHHLWNYFVDTLAHSPIDHLVITDIYSAGESALPNITAQQLAHAIKNANPALIVSYCPYDADFTQLKEHLKPLVEPGDLVLLQGAGRINKLASALI